MVERASIGGTATGRTPSQSPNKANAPKRELSPEPIRIMLDSGAYSAWSKGESIDLDKYIGYIKDNREYIDTYVSLDSIPGKKGERRTAEQTELGAKLSYQNLERMKKAGLKPIPVFHFGERWFWLERMIQDREPYIGLSPGMTIAGPAAARRWLDTAFTYLTDAKGKPLCDTHGFAMSSYPLMKRYPWTTCDATSWAQTAAFGSILLPVYKGGVPDWAEPPIKISVSAVDRKGKPPPSDHYTRMGPLQAQRVKDFLENHVGVSVLDAAQDYEVRAKAIIFFTKKFEVAASIDRFMHRVRL